MMARLVLAVAVLILSALPARAVDIQRVVSAGGIEAWLVENHAIPLIAVEVGFHAGSHLDPEGRGGLATLVAGLLDEGAGPYDALGFQSRLEDHAIRLSFEAGMDSFYASLSTLTEHRDEAFSLLRMALTEPRFDDEPVSRVRQQLHARIVREAEDPQAIASKAWFEAVFGSHPYGRPSLGTAQSVAAITRDDLQGYLQANLTRARVKIAVVGDIDATRLRGLLDKTFGALPDTGPADDTAEISPPRTGREIVIRRDIPQSVVVLGGVGLKREDPDFYAAYVLNYILGGGGFSSRLTAEVREKRGLAYSVYTYLFPLDHAGAFMGGVATENGRVKESLSLIRNEIDSLRKSGVTAAELADAKVYLTGSYPLRFDTSGKIANELVGIQLEALGIDYIDKRNGYIEAVTLDDIKRAAARLLDSRRLTVTIVGDPKGL